MNLEQIINKIKIGLEKEEDTMDSEWINKGLATVLFIVFGSVLTKDKCVKLLIAISYLEALEFHTGMIATKKLKHMQENVFLEGFFDSHGNFKAKFVDRLIRETTEHSINQLYKEVENRLFTTN